MLIGVGEDDGESHRLAGDRPRELRGVQNSAIHRIRIDVVGPVDGEMSVEVSDDLSFRVTERAADVHVCGGIGGDEARILSTPRSGDFGDWGSGRTHAGKRDGDGENARELDDADPRHV